MWKNITISVQPAIEPVSVDEVKDNLRIDGYEQDAMIANLIKATRIAVETKLHRTLIETTYIQRHDKFDDTIELFRPPAIDVSNIEYVDENGDAQTLDPAKYAVDTASEPARIAPIYGESWPTARNSLNAVSITFKAGYGSDASDVPEPIRQAVIMLASDIFEHPEANLELKLTENQTLKFLLSSFAFPELGAY